MDSSINLVKMVIEANYSAMNYHQLLDIDLALTWANETIKNLLPVKKQEELDSLKSKYTTLAARNVEDQRVTDNLPEDGNSPALSENAHLNASEEEETVENNPIDSQEKDPINSSHKGKRATVKKKTIVEEALELVKSKPLIGGIDANAPYYLCYLLKKNGNGVLEPFGMGSCGWNSNAEVLEKLKMAERAHVESDYKNVVTTPMGDYMVYQMGSKTVRVSYYKMTGTPLEPEYRQLTEDDLLDIELGNGLSDKIETKKKKKDPRSVKVVGTKGVVTKTWNSFRECELDLGVGHGVVSQYFSRHLRTLKGWTLKKETK